MRYVKLPRCVRFLNWHIEGVAHLRGSGTGYFCDGWADISQSGIKGFKPGAMSTVQ